MVSFVPHWEYAPQLSNTHAHAHTHTHTHTHTHRNTLTQPNARDRVADWVLDEGRRGFLQPSELCGVVALLAGQLGASRMEPTAPGAYRWGGRREQEGA